ncbi:MAG: metallophosphoesterase [Bacilli bacterium]|nr:metallophosphoesterase [Bacilli bacterium]
MNTKKPTALLILSILSLSLLSGCGGGDSSSLSSSAQSSRSESSSARPSSSESLISGPSSSSPSIAKATIVVNNGTGGGIFEIGQEITIVAIVPEGKEFSHWEKDGQAVSTSASYTFLVEEDATFTAFFKDKENEMAAYTKTVYKKAGKDFKVLNLTDIQLHDGEDPEISLSVIDQLVAKETPDMITFLGDLLNDNRTYPSVKNFATVLDHIDSLNIPWAPIFGNHDYEDYQAGYASAKTTTSDDLIAYFNKCENCLFTRGPSWVNGKSNYIVNVLDLNTDLPVYTLFFMDSRLSGLQDSHETFYRKGMEYVEELTGGSPVKSTVFTHIAVPEYGDAIANSKKIEYRDITGSYNRDPEDLASGTRKLFEAIQELDGTENIICGHDHENAYYTVYQGVRLAYSMKSSNGDKYSNPAEIGGSVLAISDGSSDFYYSKANIAFESQESDDTHRQIMTIAPDTLPYWKYSGGKLAFDIEFLAASGAISCSLHGTNVMRYSVSDKDKIGAWNRLSKMIEFDIANKTVNYGELELIEGSKYRFTLDLSAVMCNDVAGEVACGEETARLFYMSGDGPLSRYAISNVNYAFENIVETDQIDLSSASIAPIADQDYFFGQYVRPSVTVSVGGKTLKPIDDYLAIYENNVEVGEAMVRVVPSGKGAHRYKGEAVSAFNIVVNPDADTKPGHENANVVNDAAFTINGGGLTPLNDWYNSGKCFYFEIKPLLKGSRQSGQTIQFALHGKNSNPGHVEKETSDWNRLTRYYILDFSNDSVSVHLSGDATNVAAVTDLGDRWWGVAIPYANLQLNSDQGARGNENETFTLCYINNITRSFKIDKISSTKSI